MRALASVLALALFAPITATAQTTCTGGPTPAGAQCGNSLRFSCCTSGSYCQPWDGNYYQCISVPSGCGAMETNVDYVGTDVASHFGLQQPSECCDKCKENPQCEYFVYINTWGPACYLKKDRGAQKMMIGAALGFKSVTPTPTTAAPSGCASLETNVDYDGNDLYSTVTADVAACCALCDAESSCKVFTYATGSKTCYLKHTVGAKSVSANVVSGVKTSVTPTPTTLQPSTCPVVEKDTDYYGNDLKYVGGVTQEQCCAACQGEPACKAFTYVASWQGCYLKSSTGSKKAMPGAVSGVLTVTPTPTTPTPTTPTPTTPTPTTPLPVPSTCAAVENGIDYSGNDLKAVANLDLAGCCSACNAEKACKAFTYVYNTCYMKTSIDAKSVLPGAVSGGKVSACANTEVGVDLFGGDLRSFTATDQSACCDECNANANCLAFTYVTSSGACNLKKAGYERRTGSGLVSGIKKSGSMCVAVGGSCGGGVTCCGTNYCHPLAVTNYVCLSAPDTCAAGLETDTDYFGFDVRTVSGVDNLADCCDACNNEPKCVVFTFSKQYNACYLKSSAAGRTRIVGNISGKRRPTPTPTTPTPTTPPVTPKPTTPMPPVGPWDVARCGQQKRNIFYHGNDIAGSEKVLETVEECCDHCRATANCKAFTYFKRNAQRRCLLKAGTTLEKSNYANALNAYVASGVMA